MGNSFKKLDSFNINEEVSLLFKITTALSSTLDLNETVTEIFSILTEKLGELKAVLLIQASFEKESYSKMPFGFDPSEEEIEFLIRVAAESLQSGKTLFIPRLTEDDIFLGNHEKNEVSEESFICVPIILGDDRFGAIVVDCPYENDRFLKKNIKMFSILAIMIGQELRLARLLNMEKEALRSENVKLKDELKEKYNIHNMIGKSNKMFHVYETIKQVASSTATVLIRGESGTGKELVAHAIHYNSNRSNFPFIKINCGAIPEQLLESELFGHEKGAFTDASIRKIGKLEAANGGTVFFDEIGELPHLLQVKLLRVLQEKEITRVGGLVPIPLNLRILTATNKDLEAMLKENLFREDLYYRLNVFPIYLPGLRERRSDILLLAEHFLERFSKENLKIITSISRESIDRLVSYPWPGNVRELMNCMERAVILCNGIQVDVSHLPPRLQAIEIVESFEDSSDSYKDKILSYEKKIITDALKKSNGNHSEAARLLGTTPRVIGYKVKLFES
jgi:Nif-specific regulatory protein